MKTILNRLIQHETLSKEEAKEVLVHIAKGSYNISQIAAFLTVYMMRSVTIEELTGFRDALLELCVPIDLSDYDPIDLCGTGGDGKDTFNISKSEKRKVKTSIKEGLGMASKPAGKSTASKKAVISESNDMMARFQKLANIKINQ